jgi:hydroxyethylthiazole kinase-like uncharacterized protein yjeF
VLPLPAEPDGTLGGAAVDAARELLEGADAVVLGPGMRNPDNTRAFVAGLMPALPADAAVVLDALALTCGVLDEPPGTRGLILTPNTREADRLLGDEASADDDGTAALLASRLGAVVALRSRVADPDGRQWVDGSGNSGLGTSGSGDVLAGAVAGLAARGATPAQAAVWGVHLHAGAGELLAARVGRLGYLARELLDELPRLLGELDT